MSCSLSTFPTTRQVGAVASPAALRAVTERLQQPDAVGAGCVDVRRPNYLLDVPVSAVDVDRWQTRWQEAATAAAASSPAVPGLGGGGGGAYFQHPSVVYAALMRGEEAAASPATAAAPTQPSASAARHLAPLPPFNFATVKTLPMTQQLKLRRQWLPHRQRFPVHQQRMGFLDAVLNHALVALVGPAGSGRTLQVPMVLSETEVLKRRRLVVVSANAAAARLTARRLREERGEDVRVSRTVAAAVPVHNEAAECSSIVVTTPEILVRQLLCDPCLEDVGCVVVDDAHVRSEATELCLAMLRDLLTAQQQWEHQRSAAAAAAAAAAVSSAPSSGVAADTAQGSDALRRRRLHVVLNCPDEASATTLLTYMTYSATSRFTATTFTLQAAPSLTTASTTLYVEEAVQWLLKCEREGSCLLRDGATVEAALTSYAENVDAVARIMAASDADFAHPAAFRRYWLPLVLQCVDEFDKADRLAVAAAAAAATTSGAAAAPLSAIVVVAPNNHFVHVLANALAEARGAAAEGDAASLRVCTALADDAPFASFLAVAQRTTVHGAHERCVVVATGELSQTVLPVGLDVGLVVDCARNGYTTVDRVTMADVAVVEYSTIAQLRYRRRIAKLSLSDGAGAATPPTTPVVIQLIPKSVLHGANHRRLSADPAQHTVFRLPFSRYVQLYEVLQAREEAAVAQRAAAAEQSGGTFSALLNNPNFTNAGAGALSIASRVSTLLAAQLIGVPAATATCYEGVRRIMAAVETHLRAAGHLAIEQTRGSPAMGQLVLQPMAVLCLCLPVPLQVGRLLVASSVLRPSLAAVTAVGALWCCSDVLSLHGAGAVRVSDASDAAREAAEEQAALLAEARLFFSRDSHSDVVSAFHVYQMWCSVKARPEAERDFLEECGVAAAVLQAVFDTQVQLCAMLRTYGLVQPAPSTALPGESAAERALRVCVGSLCQRQRSADGVAQLEAALEAAMVALSPEGAASRTLHACVTAALYPSCAVPTGASGVALLYDGAPTAAPPAGRRVASFGSDCVLAHAGGGGSSATAGGGAYVFLAKSVADVATREAAVGSATSSAAATVVEQVDPLHEAAAVVFCGHAYERPRRAPLRCRGWSSMLTTRWRQTRRARALPPVAQLPPTRIPVQSYDTVHCEHVVCVMDYNVALTMRATTSRWLHQLRAHVQQQLTALARGTAADGQDSAGAADDLVSELAQAWAWWERRHETGREWLREERLVVSHQQPPPPQDASAEGGQDREASAAEPDTEGAAKLAALRQRLFAFYEWQTRPGAPTAVVVPSNAERKAYARTVAAAAAAAATSKGGEDDEDGEGAAAAEGGEGAEEGEESGSALPATYTGKVPPPDVDTIFRMCVKSVAAKGTREAEAQLLRDNPDMFSFLNPEDGFHEYYLYLLRQAAPDMEVLGDNLEELITFLEGLETELRQELGLPDPSTADADAGAAQGETGDGTGMWAAGGAGNGPWDGTGSGGYAVHEMPAVADGDVYGYGDGDDGGLQLESAAVNLKKSAGPTLAEKIEEAKRTQGSTAGSGSSAVVVPSTSMGGVGAAPATELLPPPTSIMPAGAPGMQLPMMSAATLSGSGGAATSRAAPFVSTNTGETLADRLRAMQMAARGGVSAADPFAGPPTSAPASTSAPPADAAPFAPPTAADLLAAINGTDSAPDAATFAPTPHPQHQHHQPQPSSSVLASTAPMFHFQQAPPTAEELMALLGAPPSASPSALPGVLGGGAAAPMAGLLHGGGGGASSHAMLPSVAAMLGLGRPATPLHRPPPAIPAKAIEERAPSVLVYPVPNPRTFHNVRMLLAKSLGECLNMRVGPTLIVGHVARIDVPNRNVEARALALKKFTCAEADVTVYLFKNDRIIDDPVAQHQARVRRREEQRQDVAERRRRTEGGEPSGGASAALRLRQLRAAPDAPHGNSRSEPRVPATPLDLASAAGLRDPSAFGVDAPVPALRIGVVSSDDDSDGDGSSSSSSSSSASSSSS